MGRTPSCLCGECKKCKRREYMREWYQAKTPEERREWVARRDKERVRRDDRRRSSTEVRRMHNTRNTKKWRNENPEKYAAHIAVNNAIRKGEIVKQPCEECGSTHRVHAHHDDYSKPLEVRWLCPLHHAEERLKDVT